ncbi:MULTISPECIES: acyltransferase family protein [unclassified Enterococcus]|uniref:acyltransferase family protein n=1 Tax=unclassified Enterococcus TaxID=2608891 RepID=UPI001CE216D2|nr:MULTISPECIES: acyltransferase [unclassified Enterococcus]MCA5013983.1 acyltransferase [Enterococcus sp. S23]MCA5017243.1 acyltransferase [Enterococcus sp. S22(2020)]
MDLLLLLSLIFFFFYMEKNSTTKDLTLSVQTTSNIQCVLVIIIMMHHISQVTAGAAGSLLSTSLSVAGRLAVSVFFFISGYGIFKQYLMKKQQYLKNFLQKRLGPLILSYILAMIIYFVYRNISGDLSVKAALKSLFNGSPFVSNSWYVIAIFFFYLLFYLSGKISKNNTMFIVLLFLGTALFFSVSRYIGYGEWWYNAVFAFPVGTWWAFQEAKNVSLLGKRYKLYVAGIALAFSVFFYLDEIVPSIYFREVACITFAILVISLSYKYWINVPFFANMKKMSFELYLYHGLMISALKNQTWLVEKRFLYGLLVIVLTVLMSYLVRIMTNIIVNFFVKNNVNSSNHYNEIEKSRT